MFTDTRRSQISSSYFIPHTWLVSVQAVTVFYLPSLHFRKVATSSRLSGTQIVASSTRSECRIDSFRVARWHLDVQCAQYVRIQVLGHVRNRLWAFALGRGSRRCWTCLLLVCRAMPRTHSAHSAHSGAMDNYLPTEYRFLRNTQTYCIRTGTTSCLLMHGHAEYSDGVLVLCLRISISQSNRP